MRELHGGSRDGLEIYPNLWAGVGLVRGGAGTALVGSHTEVADRILEYAALGIDEFILSGYPNLEEAYWFGEGVLPILAARGVWQHPRPRGGRRDRERHPVRPHVGGRPRCGIMMAGPGEQPGEPREKTRETKETSCPVSPWWSATPSPRRGR